MESDGPRAAEAFDPRLDDRIVELLSREGGRLAFNGLRRALRVHPETLSRALRRLERGGAVLHDTVGYAVADDARSGDLGSLSRDLRSIAELDLPDPWTEEAVLGTLAGRWSGALRWVGSSERPEGIAMIWSVPADGARVVLTVRARHLSVLISSPSATPPERTERAALGLLRHVLEGPESRVGRRAEPRITAFDAAERSVARRDN